MKKDFNPNAIVNTLFGLANGIKEEEILDGSHFLTFKKYASVSISRDMSKKDFDKYFALCSPEEQDIITNGGTVDISRRECRERMGRMMDRSLEGLDAKEVAEVLTEMKGRVTKIEEEIAEIEADKEALQKPDESNKSETFYEQFHEYVAKKEWYRKCVAGAEKEADDTRELCEIVLEHSSVLGAQKTME